MDIKFVREESGAWYFHSPEYLYENGADSKGDLLMVAGADVLLDILSQGKDSVSIEVDTFPIKGENIITCIKQSEDDKSAGATYYANGKSFKDFQFWLCPVTLWVLNEYPDVMFFKQKQG